MVVAADFFAGAFFFVAVAVVFLTALIGLSKRTGSSDEGRISIAIDRRERKSYAYIFFFFASTNSIPELLLLSDATASSSCDSLSDTASNCCKKANAYDVSKLEKTETASTKRQRLTSAFLAAAGFFDSAFDLPFPFTLEVEASLARLAFEASELSPSDSDAECPRRADLPFALLAYGRYVWSESRVSMRALETLAAEINPPVSLHPFRPNSLWLSPTACKQR